MNKPTPGSVAAEERGCICPIIDNHYGEGVPMNGKREFWITAGCKLHDKPGNNGLKE